MPVIFKYPLSNAATQTVTLPTNAELLSAHFQQNQLCLWALIDPDAPDSAWQVRVLATGEPVPDRGTLGRFVGTAHAPDGTVWHVFGQPESGHSSNFPSVATVLISKATHD